MFVYTLTDLTGRRRNNDRRHVIATFEVPHRAAIVGVVSLLASVPVVMLFTLVFGGYALLVLPVLMVAGQVLFNSRMKNGLELHRFQAILNKRQAVNGQFLHNGIPMADPMFIWHSRQFVDGDITNTPVVDVFVGGAATDEKSSPVISSPAKKKKNGVSDASWL